MDIERISSPAAHFLWALISKHSYMDLLKLEKRGKSIEFPYRRLIALVTLDNVLFSLP